MILEKKKNALNMERGTENSPFSAPCVGSSTKKPMPECGTAVAEHETR